MERMSKRIRRITCICDADLRLILVDRCPLEDLALAREVLDFLDVGCHVAEHFKVAPDQHEISISVVVVQLLQFLSALARGVERIDDNLAPVDSPDPARTRPAFRADDQPFRSYLVHDERGLRVEGQFLRDECGDVSLKLVAHDLHTHASRN